MKRAITVLAFPLFAMSLTNTWAGTDERPFADQIENKGSMTLHDTPEAQELIKQLMSGQKSAEEKQHIVNKLKAMGAAYEKENPKISSPK